MPPRGAGEHRVKVGDYGALCGGVVDDIWCVAKAFVHAKWLVGGVGLRICCWCNKLALLPHGGKC